MRALAASAAEISTPASRYSMEALESTPRPKRFGKRGRRAPPGCRSRQIRFLQHMAETTFEYARLEQTLEERRQRVEAALRRLVTSGQAPAIDAAIESSLFAPTKRLRPMLSLLVAEVLKNDPDAVLPANCAIEIVHTASLILNNLPSIDDTKL